MMYPGTSLVSPKSESPIIAYGVSTPISYHYLEPLTRAFSIFLKHETTFHEISVFLLYSVKQGETKTMIS